MLVVEAIPITDRYNIGTARHPVEGAKYARAMMIADDDLVLLVLGSAKVISGEK